MKKNNILKYSSSALAVIIAGLSISGCTKKFEDFNTNSNLLTKEQTINLVASAIGPIETAEYTNSNYQVTQNLSGDTYAGYSMSPSPFAGGLNNSNYALVDGWNSRGFTEYYAASANAPAAGVMDRIAALGRANARVTVPEVWGIALLVQVHAAQRVTDRFGPIPYTQAGKSFTTIPYDDQKTVYQEFFKQLDTALTNLRKYVSVNGVNHLGASDLIYGGDCTKWIKFANSLRLRLATRIVKADPALAKQQGEIALAAPEGLLADNADNALLKQAGGSINNIYLETLLYGGDDINGLGGDNMLNASFGTYMEGYKDPRAPILIIPAREPAIAGKYVGIRIGANVAPREKYQKFANPNYKVAFKQADPQIVMTAAESWFLKAEAALRGWAGAGDAKTNYETGIKTSMSQWGASIGSYLSDATSKQADYVDPLNAVNSINAMSTITIAWNDGDTQERKLERIMTQKWIALFPDGLEAWAEYRRTGYPKLFPVVQNNSNGTIDTQIQIRRLPFPASEKLTDPQGFATGLSALGGPDNGGTRLWWDKAGPNF